MKSISSTLLLFEDLNAKWDWSRQTGHLDISSRESGEHNKEWYSQKESDFFQMTWHVTEFIFIFPFLLYWSEACMEPYCFSAYWTSSPHFFRDKAWLSVQKENAKQFHRVILQMGIQIYSRGHADSLEVRFKNLKRTRWLTMELKPEEILGSPPSVGQLFPSRGLLKSSIMKNFILPLNVGWKPQQWSEFGQIVLRTETT